MDYPSSSSIKIGLTYDLRKDYVNLGLTEEELAEFDSEETIISIENTLQSLGFHTERIGNIKNLIKNLSDGKRWDLVFNICEGIYGYGRESQVPAILDAYQIPYTFSDPLTLSIALHKGYAKEIVKNHKIKTPDFYIIENLDELNKKINEIKKLNINFPLFVKPIAGGTGIGVSKNSKVLNFRELEIQTEEIIRKYKQPAIIEEFLPGKEYTVAILGTGENSKILGAMEIILKENAEEEVYSYYNKENCEKLVYYKKAEDENAKEASKIALEVHKILNCKDSSRVDIRLDKNGVPHFLEINPLAGLHPTHSDLPIIASMFDFSYIDLIKFIVNSALNRANYKQVMV
ncbi:MAG: ATP-grasp domain-containing protein [Spirochaetes bacterium]|nr:ATP-grasp domain-containing protein [Spirochaetota bacterium]